MAKLSYDKTSSGFLISTLGDVQGPAILPHHHRHWPGQREVRVRCREAHHPHRHRAGDLQHWLGLPSVKHLSDFNFYTLYSLSIVPSPLDVHDHSSKEQINEQLSCTNMFTQWNPNERSARTKKASNCSGHKETLMLAIVGLIPIQINSFKVEKTFVNLYFTLYRLGRLMKN